MRNKPAGGTFHIEDIQDQVELALMRSGEHEVARAYVLYREKRAQERAARQRADAAGPAGDCTSSTAAFGARSISRHCARWWSRPAKVSAKASASTPVLGETVKNLYDGVPLDEVYKSAILSARALIEKDPAYSQVTARLLLHTMRREVLGEEVLAAADVGALRASTSRS